jgi:hypothetical protein
VPPHITQQLTSKDELIKELTSKLKDSTNVIKDLNVKFCNLQAEKHDNVSNADETNKIIELEKHIRELTSANIKKINEQI